MQVKLRTSHDFLLFLFFFSLFLFLSGIKKRGRTVFLRKILLSSDRLMKCFSSTLDKYFTCKFFLNWFNLYYYNYREIFYQIARGHCNAKVEEMIVKWNCDILVIFWKSKIGTMDRQNERHQFTVANVKQIIKVC